MFELQFIRLFFTDKFFDDQLEFSLFCLILHRGTVYRQRGAFLIFTVPRGDYLICVLGLFHSSLRIDEDSVDLCHETEIVLTSDISGVLGYHLDDIVIKVGL